MGRVMITIKEFSAKAKLSEAHVRQLLRDGKIVGVKAGKEWRISNDEADRYLGIKTDSESIKKDLYIKDLESKVKTYEVQLCTLKNMINTMGEIVRTN